MVKVQLPFQEIYVCEICGEVATNPGRIAEHENSSPTETTEFKPGDVVLLYENAPEIRMTTRMRLVKTNLGLSKDPHPWTVTKFHYSGSHGLTSVRPTSEYRSWTPLPLHTLCVTLRRQIDDAGAYTLKTLTYRTFLLLREGNREELEAIGLVTPKTVPVPHLLSGKEIAPTEDTRGVH